MILCENYLNIINIQLYEDMIYCMQNGWVKKDSISEAGRKKHHIVYFYTHDIN